MSKVDIEKLVYKKPDLTLGFNFLNKVHKSSEEEEDGDLPWLPTPTPAVEDPQNPTGEWGGQ